jgi:DNA-binding transcriptional MerR regulator
MNNIKNVFSIKDLENLSGIKAHTIRMWEKRYGILEPMRTDTNIRLYDLSELRKLLNIVLLHDHGYKISKIATFPEDRIPQLARDIISKNSINNQAINDFKIAMLHFNQGLFIETYDKLLSEKSFRDVFYGVFLPLLTELGLLWQSETISPAHEHFISYLIQQKLLLNIESLQTAKPVKKEKVFVLYLPSQEIHQLGLMYIYYEILFHGYTAIYLGESVPVDNLKDLKNHFDNIVFVTYLTVEPHPDEVTRYISRISEEVLGNDSQLWFTGRLSGYSDASILSDRVRRFDSIAQLVNQL